MARRRVGTKRVGVAVLSLLFVLSLAALGVALPVVGSPTAVAPLTPPSLDWTGEPGYEADGVEPNSGYRTTPFAFRVRYADPDGLSPSPGTPKLDVRKNGVPIAGSPFTLAFAAWVGAPGDYVAGAIYNATVRPPYVGSDYDYHFSGSDAQDPAGGSATGWTRGPEVVDRGPTLEWTGEPGFEADGVSPDAGTPSTLFEWRVRYTDPDDDPPDAGYPLLHVLKSGSEISGSPFRMGGADPSDTTFADGKVYWYFRSLALGANYTYYFEAQSLGLDASTSVLPGPTVSPPPNQPPLVFLNSPTGGERWLAGSRRIITWGMGDPDDDPDSLTVDLFLLEGTSRQRIAGPTLGQVGFDWVVPSREILGVRVEIVVTDPGGLNVSDISGPFDIVLSSDTTLPVARFTVDPQSPYVGVSVALDGSTSTDDSGSIASYAWSIYDAGGALVASYSGPTATHAFASSGTYRIVLNVMDASGNWDEEEREVLVMERGQTPGAFPAWILGMILLAVVTLVVVAVLVRRRKKRVEPL